MFLVPESKKFLENIRTQISSVPKVVPLEPLSIVSQNIQYAQDNITKYAPEAQKIDSTR